MEKIEVVKKQLGLIEKDFLDKYEAIIKKYEADVSNLDKQLEATLKEQIELKNQEKENNGKLKLQLDAIELKKKDLEAVEGNLKKEIDRYNALCNKQEKTIAKHAENLKDSEIAKKLSNDELLKHKAKTEEHSILIASLKKDFDVNEAKRKELAELERVLAIQQKEILKQKELIAAKEKELAEKEIDIKLKEKNVHVEMKRKKLEA